MYHAKVMVASKVRKNDLPVTSGDTVSIIRTTNCPKGKWLARDANHKCELNLLVVFKRANAAPFITLHLLLLSLLQLFIWIFDNFGGKTI